MKNEFLQQSKAKILNWNRENYHDLANSMTTDELNAMRQELINNYYPLSPDTSPQQTIYDYILFLLYEAENSDCVDADTYKLYDILYCL